MVAGMGLPPLRGSELLSGVFNALPAVMLLAALALYLWGVRRVNRLQPRHPWKRRKTVAFLFGLAVTALAIFSFIGRYQQELFWDHMIQHLLFIMVAAPLFAISSPIDLAWRATTGNTRARLSEFLRSGPARLLGSPVVAFVLYAVMIPLTHLTSWYNYTIEHPAWDDFEHLVFLVIGYLFWRHLFGSDPNRNRLHPGGQFLILFLAIPVDTFTGLSLDQASHQLFPAYTAFHRTWGVGPILDLHIGGVIMWVGGDTLMLWPMIPVALRWLHLEERRAVRADRELDAAGYTELEALDEPLTGFPFTGSS